MAHYNELNAMTLKLDVYTAIAGATNAPVLPVASTQNAGMIMSAYTTASPTVAVPVWSDGTAWKLITIGATAS